MGFDIEGEYMGEITFGLFGNVVPKTVANFAALCNQYSGAVDMEGNAMLYSGTIFNIIMPGHMIQGGNH